MSHAPTDMNIVPQYSWPFRNDTPQHPEGIEREPVTVDSSNFRVCVQETLPLGAAAHPCDGFPLKKI